MYHDHKQIYLWDGMKRTLLNMWPCVLIVIRLRQKWEATNMDFLDGLLKNRRQNYSIWVIVDRMTMSAHFILVKSTYSVED